MQVASNALALPLCALTRCGLSFSSLDSVSFNIRACLIRKKYEEILRHKHRETSYETTRSCRVFRP
jgi:hypothetical protein